MLRLIPAGPHRLAYRLAHAVRIRYWQATGARLNGVAVVATELNDQLLLIRLSYGSGGWNLPTGGLKRGEDIEVAARRELEEETGCKANSLALIGVQDDILHGAQNTVHVFKARVSGQPKGDMREVIEARFFPMHSLPEPLTKSTRRRLELYREHSQQR